MEGLQIALVISAIIEIIILICFFVLCSNVSKIKKTIEQKHDFSAKFDFLINIGEKEKARDLLIKRILNNNGIFSSEVIWSSKEKTEMCFKTYKDELEAVGIENPFKEENNK